MDTDLTLDMEVESEDHVGSNKIATSSKSKKRKSRSSAAMNEASVTVASVSSKHKLSSSSSDNIRKSSDYICQGVSSKHCSSSDVRNQSDPTRQASESKHDSNPSTSSKIRGLLDLTRMSQDGNTKTAIISDPDDPAGRNSVDTAKEDVYASEYNLRDLLITLHEQIANIGNQVNEMQQRNQHVRLEETNDTDEDSEYSEDRDLSNQSPIPSKRTKQSDKNTLSEGELSDNDNESHCIQSIMLKDATQATHKESDDLLEQMWHDWTNADNGQTGPEVNEKLAKLSNTLHTNNSDKETIEIRIKKYVRPKNCTQLVTPKINLEIFKQLSHREQLIDKVLSNIQQSGIAASISIVHAINEIRNVKLHSVDETNKILGILTDSLALQGHVFNSLNTHRRENLKGTFKNEFSTLCTNRTIVEDGLLFGSNLAKTLKEIKDENRMAMDCVSKSQNTYGNVKRGTSFSTKKFRGMNRNNYFPKGDRQYTRPIPTSRQQKPQIFLSRNRFPVNRKLRGKPY